jgi:sugar O-acyltransferase (sialic acid O-acetyltransferase NeuD family)
MNKPKIILIGAGGHAHACIDVIEQQDQFSIGGLVGIPEEMHSRHLGYSVIATDGDLAQLVKEYQYAFITVGQILSPNNRIRLYQRATELGFIFPAIIAPTSHVSSHAIVAKGTIVMHGAIVNAAAKVGENCIINTRSLIEHDATVEDHCHISTGAIINGRVNVGAGSFIGSGCVIKDGVSIGKGCVVGMGLSVRSNQVGSVQFVGKNKC